MNLGQCGANQDSTRKTETENSAETNNPLAPCPPGPRRFPDRPRGPLPPGRLRLRGCLAHHPIRCAKFSPIITHVRCKFARQSVGMIEASHTSSPSTPRTRKSGSTTPR